VVDLSDHDSNNFANMRDGLNKSLMVGLSDLDSNNYYSIITFKESLLSQTQSATLPKIISPTDRHVNEHGEILVGKMRQEQKRLNEEEIKLLIDGYKEGKSTYALALQFGCHRSTVSNILKRYGIAVSKCKAQKKLNAADVAAMYENMHTSAEIAERYKVNPQAIIHCLRNQGIKTRGRWDY